MANTTKVYIKTPLVIPSERFINFFDTNKLFTEKSKSCLSSLKRNHGKEIHDETEYNEELIFSKMPLILDFDSENGLIKKWKKIISFIELSDVKAMSIEKNKLPFLLVDYNGESLKEKINNQKKANDDETSFNFIHNAILMDFYGSINSEYKIQNINENYFVIINKDLIIKKFKTEFFEGILKKSSDKKKIQENVKTIENIFTTIVSRICDFCVFRPFQTKKYFNQSISTFLCYLDGTNIVSRSPIMIIFMLLSFITNSISKSKKNSSENVFHGVMNCIKFYAADENTFHLGNYCHFIHSENLKVPPQKYIFENWHTMSTDHTLTYTTMNRLFEYNVQKMNHWFKTCAFVNGKPIVTDNFISFIEEEYTLRDQYNQKKTLIFFNWKDVCNVIEKNKKKKPLPISTFTSVSKIEGLSPKKSINNDDTNNPSPPPKKNLQDDSPILKVSLFDILTSEGNDRHLDSPKNVISSKKTPTVSSSSSNNGGGNLEHILQKVGELMDRKNNELFEKIVHYIDSEKEKERDELMKSFQPFAINSETNSLKTLIDDDEEEQTNNRRMNLKTSRNKKNNHIIIQDEDIDDISDEEDAEFEYEDSEEEYEEEDYSSEEEDPFDSLKIKEMIVQIPHEKIHSSFKIDTKTTPTLVVSNYELFEISNDDEDENDERNIEYDDSSFSKELAKKEEKQMIVKEFLTCGMKSLCQNEENDLIIPHGFLGYIFNVDFKDIGQEIIQNIKKNNGQDTNGFKPLFDLLALREFIAGNANNRRLINLKIDEFKRDTDISEVLINSFEDSDIGSKEMLHLCTTCRHSSETLRIKKDIYLKNGGNPNSNIDNPCKTYEIQQNMLSHVSNTFSILLNFNVHNEYCLNCNNGFYLNDALGRKEYVVISYDYKNLSKLTLNYLFKNIPKNLNIVIKIPIVKSKNENGVAFCCSHCEKSFKKYNTKLKSFLKNK